MRELLHLPRARRLALPVLVLSLMLGHVCELRPHAGPAVASHESQHPGHGNHDRSSATEISCGAVDVLPSSGCAPTGPDRDAVAPLSRLATPTPGRLIASSREGSPGLRSRPPLFLLYASLLI